MKCCGNKHQEADHVCNGICPNGYKFDPTYVVRHLCIRCGENVGYLGWLFTTLRIPMLKHKCKEKNSD